MTRAGLGPGATPGASLQVGTSRAATTAPAPVLRPPCLSRPLPLPASAALPANRHMDVETIEAECNHCLQKKMVQDLFIGR